MEKILGVRGMNDLLPEKLRIWRVVENKIISVFKSYGIEEIRTPILERTELFLRGLGEATDIVEKEMYSFQDQLNDQFLSLRPESTAPVVRSVVQHSLAYNEPRKLWYYGPMFRHERPQAGRFRQFHQFGVEMFGYEGFECEAELILICGAIWAEVGLASKKTPVLKINSIGTKEERSLYIDSLRNYLKKHEDSLNDDDLRRLNINPLRILDSKDKSIEKIVCEAPKINSFLGQKSLSHFNGLLDFINANNIPFNVDLSLVRGLDYYNSVVFEWVIEEKQSQNTVCGGGRYDALVGHLGGKISSACGFALGMERLIDLIEHQQEESFDEGLDLYVAHDGEAMRLLSMGFSEKLREAGLNVRVDITSASIKSQIKRANRNRASFVAIFNLEEAKQNCVSIKSIGYESQSSRPSSVQKTMPIEQLADFLLIEKSKRRKKMI